MISARSVKDRLKQQAAARGKNMQQDFEKSEIHNRRWQAFLKKKKALINTDFAEMLHLLKILLSPIVDSIRSGHEYSSVWDCKTKAGNNRKRIKCLK